MKMFSQSGTWICEAQRRGLLRATFLSSLFLLPLSGDVAADSKVNRTAFNNHCRMCHSIKPGDNRLGPAIYGIFGADAGQVNGFNGYSGGLTGFVWDEVTLDKFMADPASVSSSTNMIFPPVKDAEERKKIIEFLKSLKRGKA